jgi:hypothetical protein
MDEGDEETFRKLLLSVVVSIARPWNTQQHMMHNTRTNFHLKPWIQRHFDQSGMFGQFGLIFAFQLLSSPIIKKGLHGTKIGSELSEGVVKALGLVHTPMLRTFASNKGIVTGADHGSLAIFLHDVLKFVFYLLDRPALAWKHKRRLLQDNFAIDNLNDRSSGRFGWSLFLVGRIGGMDGVIILCGSCSSQFGSIYFGTLETATKGTEALDAIGVFGQELF